MAETTHNTHNYFAHGGNELVIGGKLTFLPDAEVEGGEDLFVQTPSAQLAYLPDSEAGTVAALREDLNELLSALRTAGFMADAPSE